MRSGDTFAAADKRGAVFLFCVPTNRYTCLKEAKLGSPALSLDFVHHRPSFNTVVVGMGDPRCTVLCLNGESGRAEKTLSGHHAHAVTAPSRRTRAGRSCSRGRSGLVLWDAESWAKLHVLSGPGGLAVVAARFVVDGERIAVLFRDDAILVWSAEAFASSRASRCRRARGRGRARAALGGGGGGNGGGVLRAFAATRDGATFVAGGANAMLYLWDTAAERVAASSPSCRRARRRRSRSSTSPTRARCSALTDDGRVAALLFTPSGCAVQLELAPPAVAFTALGVDGTGKYLVLRSLGDDAEASPRASTSSAA